MAQTQNSADLIGGVQKVGNKNVDNAILDMTQTATIKDSLVLGRRVLDELGKLNKLHKGHVDQANFAVLRAPDIPSILVETAFLSNPTEERSFWPAADSANKVRQPLPKVCAIISTPPCSRAADEFCIGGWIRGRPSESFQTAFPLIMQ